MRFPNVIITLRRVKYELIETQKGAGLKNDFKCFLSSIDGIYKDILSEAELQYSNIQLVKIYLNSATFDEIEKEMKVIKFIFVIMFTFLTLSSHP